MAGNNVSSEPLVLLVPGHVHGATARWADDWARLGGDVQLVDLGLWDRPHRNTWVNKLNLAIQRAQRRVVVIAEGLACLAVAWWAEYERPAFGDPVSGALLVSPPDVDRPDSDPRLAPFGTCPRQPLPFPSFVVVDRRLPEPQQATATQLARDWESRIAIEDAKTSASGSRRSAPNLLRLLLGDDRSAAHGAVPPRRSEPRRGFVSGWDR